MLFFNLRTDHDTIDLKYNFFKFKHSEDFDHVLLLSLFLKKIDVNSVTVDEITILHRRRIKTEDKAKVVAAV